MQNIEKQLSICVSKKGDRCLIKVNCASLLALENKISFTFPFCTGSPAFYNMSASPLSDE